MRLNLVLIFAIKLLLLTTPSHVYCLSLFNSVIAAITTFAAVSGGANAKPSSSQASLQSQISKVGSPHTSFSDCLAEVTHAASFPAGSTFSLPACLKELEENYRLKITGLEKTIADLERDNSACELNWASEAKGRFTVNKSLQTMKRSNQRCKEKRAKCLNYMKYHKQNKHGKGRKGIG